MATNDPYFDELIDPPADGNLVLTRVWDPATESYRKWGNQRVAGLDVRGLAEFKNNIPTLPNVNPTSDNQIARKKFVDEGVNSATQAATQARIDANSYTNNEVSAAKAEVNLRTDNLLDTQEGELQTYASNQAAGALSSANSYTDTEIGSLQTNTQQLIDTSIADAKGSSWPGADPNIYDFVIQQRNAAITSATTTSNDYTDTEISGVGTDITNAINDFDTNRIGPISAVTVYQEIEDRIASGAIDAQYVEDRLDITTSFTVASYVAEERGLIDTYIHQRLGEDPNGTMGVDDGYFPQNTSVFDFTTSYVATEVDDYVSDNVINNETFKQEIRDPILPLIQDAKDEAIIDAVQNSVNIFDIPLASTLGRQVEGPSRWLFYTEYDHITAALGGTSAAQTDVLFTDPSYAAQDRENFFATRWVFDDTDPNNFNPADPSNPRVPSLNQDELVNQGRAQYVSGTDGGGNPVFFYDISSTGDPLDPQFVRAENGRFSTAFNLFYFRNRSITRGDGLFKVKLEQIGMPIVSQDSYALAGQSLILASNRNRIQDIANNSLILASQQVDLDEPFVVALGHGPTESGGTPLVPTTANINLKLYAQTGNIWSNGAVTIEGAVTDNLHAATKAYVDGEVTDMATQTWVGDNYTLSTALGTIASQDADNVSITGGSVAVTAPALDTAAARNIVVSSTAPTGLADGDIWIEVA
ncbi:MAG: hypothetical protein LC687_04185 [Actinobacteria bacterium]|nr:hypothetical protein [Actinomycetota bacterium]MCA1807034.1 hypothetical protein [Actinomycetota bacterium]